MKKIFFFYFRMIIGKERDESKESVSELQNRIKTNVETIQQLHRQVRNH